MKTTTHTPGPWAYEMFEDSESRFGTHPIAIIDGNVGYYKGSPLNSIAKISLFEAHPEASSDEIQSLKEITEANARLIAAAPELLAALKAITEQTNDEYQFADMQPMHDAQARWQSAINEARVAIAKAIGT